MMMVIRGDREYGDRTQIGVFWVVTPCGVVGYQRFGGPCCLRLQGEYASRSLQGYDAVWCCGRIPTFRRSVLPRTTTLHGVTTQKTSSSTFIAVKTWSLSWW